MDEPAGGPGFYGCRCRKHRLSLLGIECAVAAQIAAMFNVWAEWMTSRQLVSKPHQISLQRDHLGCGVRRLVEIVAREFDAEPLPNQALDLDFNLLGTAPVPTRAAPTAANNCRFSKTLSCSVSSCGKVASRSTTALSRAFRFGRRVMRKSSAKRWRAIPERFASVAHRSNGRSK